MNQDFDQEVNVNKSNTYPINHHGKTSMNEDLPKYRQNSISYLLNPTNNPGNRNSTSSTSSSGSSLSPSDSMDISQ